MHKLTLITYLITVLLKKHPIKMIKNSVCFSPQEKVIPLLVSIFFSEISYLNSQKVGLPKVSF